MDLFAFDTRRRSATHGSCQWCDLAGSKPSLIGSCEILHRFALREFLQISELSHGHARIPCTERNFNMRVGIAAATLVVFTSFGAFCQSGGKLPEFEVASIKPA